VPLHSLRKAIASASILAVLLTAPVRAQVNVTVDATKAVRVVDDRMFGLNTAVWDGAFNDPESLMALQAMDTRVMRFPGGSTSDTYHWATGMSDGNPYVWGTSFDNFASTATAIASQAVITVNYGSGTPAEAAMWVTDSNVTKGYGFKYWEVGNECYGTWENDLQTSPHDPYTYATRAVQYIQQMKTADPTIKVGVVAVTGEDTYAVGYTAHPATNPVTGVAHNGWTPVMLATMKAAKVLPDFIIYHRYEQAPGQENDALLLQDALTWPSDAAALRLLLNDYLGSAASGVEIVVTENNSVYAMPGKQSTSIVNALYLADSTANLLQTEINGLIWWDLHNGTDGTQNNSASLYGWRQYGDYGVENGDTTTNAPAHDHYPTYYVNKVLSHFARGGDTVISAASDNPLLSAYAARRLDGTLSVLVINKSPTVTYSTTFSVTGYSPQATAATYSYGIPQDTAAQTGTGSPDVAIGSISNASASFTTSFAPYSVTVVSLAVPTTAPTPSGQPSSQTIANGSTVVFSFPVSGAPTPTFQWFLNGSAVPSATSSTLVISGATAANAGTYTCVATNSSGSATSGPAQLAVVATSDPGRLINLSARAQVGTGANIIFAGFVSGGAGTSGTQSVLVRGSGPAIAAAPFNVPGTLPDPELQVFNSAQVSIDTNTAWGGTAQLVAAAAAVHAFAWGNPASHDAALDLSLAPGAYTAQVSGQSGDTGDALAEVYDATPAGTYASSTPRLINLAARVDVGTGSNALFAGFVIGGSTSLTVLIRASGPAIAVAPFNVGGTLPDPELTLQNPSTQAVIASNNGWGGNPQISTTAAAVHAFTWGDPASHDSALLITLPPGAYTAAATGASGDTGVAIVEVYEVP
jgi:hypothetical protein